MNQRNSYLEQARRYAIAVTPADDGTYVARAVDFPDAVGGGLTPGAAADALIDGIAAFLEHDPQGDNPPPMSGYSGVVSVRLPRTLHRAIVARAEAEGVSVNSEIAFLLTQAVGLEGVVRPARRRRTDSRRPDAPTAAAD